MNYDIICIIWNDAFAFDEEELSKENFQLSPTVQCGLLIDEDDEKIRIADGFSLNHDEHDFIIIPKATIVKRKKIGRFNTKTKEINTS
jgi:hypothetical protein